MPQHLCGHQGDNFRLGTKNLLSAEPSHLPISLLRGFCAEGLKIDISSYMLDHMAYEYPKI